MTRTCFKSVGQASLCLSVAHGDARLTSVITADDEDSFYQGVVERLAARQAFKDSDDQTRGPVMMEIDCGLPWQTSACQAGIMFGDNHDIPAFRWYDKDEQKLLVSGKDAAFSNDRYATGNRLIRA